MITAFTIVLVTVLGSTWLFGRSPTKAKTASDTTLSSYKKACDLFKLQDAQNVLGSGAQKGSSTQTNSESAQRSVTTCTYSYDPGSLSDLVTATVLVRASSDAEAKKSFESSRSDNAQDIKDYGDAAYWNPSLGQINLLKGNYWVTVSAGAGPLDSRQQDLPTKIAGIIVKRI